MELKLYQCEHCGNIIYKAYDSGVSVVCCGEKMGEMAVSGQGAKEKHVPVVEKDGDNVTVSVSSVIHPMVEEHFIGIIAATNEDTVVFKHPKMDSEPILKTILEGDVKAYEWCNLHGYWMSE